MDKILGQSAVLQANDAFYAAFSAGDYLAMEQLWSRRAEISCSHPGWPEIEGREPVLDSWYSILVLGERLNVLTSNPTVIRHGTTGLVYCIEHFGDVLLVGANTFVVEDGSWRMVSHQAAHLPG